MTTSTTPDTFNPAKAMFVLGVALTVAPLILGTCVYVLLSPHANPLGSGAEIAAMLTVYTLIHLGLNKYGYRVPAVNPGWTEEEKTDHVLFRTQQAMILRMVTIEAPLMVSIALAFLFPEFGLATAMGAAVGATLVSAIHLIPRTEHFDRVQESFNSDGASIDVHTILNSDQSVA